MPRIQEFGIANPNNECDATRAGEFFFVPLYEKILIFPFYNLVFVF